MNSGKRGPAYGFKIQSLDNLLDTKSSDKKMTLLHYIEATVNEQFPEVATFDTDIRYVEKASAGEEDSG